MEKDTFMRCTLFSSASVPFLILAVLIIFSGEDRGLTDDRIILYSGVCVAAMLIVSAIVFIFAKKTLLMKKRPEAQLRTVRSAGGEDRRIGIIISSHITRGRVKLFMDGKEIAEGRGGDRFRVSLASGEHRLGIKPGKDSTGYIIQAEEAGDVYVWYHSLMLRADRVAGGIEKMAEADAAGHRATERILIINMIMTPLVFALVVVMILLL